ncbi:unnamed protein product [Rotaria socialis]|uniref:Uncharacterized protein n=1 Tax=Rotaria socialis TaxID=392032 RepID=A0A820T7D4_9BILA|nr:unnamed protein product [Rotaria socialis]CAF3440276.1 unnamed protein product [Rotaria socialis]CAF3519593.1 unnamed protein product [Rotaria socialis]CAF4466458.1 unnamed protein product [Rotaria socialis]CAF4552397.1 unnamed protein product [Rotaria socialis]
MPSSNHRSSSTRPSRTTSNRLQVHVVRSASVPQRQFIFILTNNPELLRHTQELQPRPAQPRQTTTTSALRQNTNNNQNHRPTTDTREEVLNDLLRIELRDVARDYLTRTRRSYPIHYVFDMTDIEPRQS